jgi:Phage-related protein, predicted endonuclease
MIAVIVAKLIEFKTNCDNGIAPPAKTENDIKVKWTAPTEETTTVDDKIAEKVDMYKLLSRQKKEIEDRMDEIKVELEDTFGNKSYMQNGNGDLIATFKATERSSFDTKRFKTDNPDLAEEYTKVTSSRTLRIK